MGYYVTCSKVHIGHFRAFRCTNQYIIRVEDTVYAVIAVEADLRAERKSGTKDVSLGTKYLLLSDSTIRAKDGNNLV